MSSAQYNKSPNQNIYIYIFYLKHKLSISPWKLHQVVDFDISNIEGTELFGFLWI